MPGPPVETLPAAAIGLPELDAMEAPRTFVPSYFTAADQPWLAALLDERERHVGQKRRQWQERVDAGLPRSPPVTKLRTALGVLERLAKERSGTRAPAQRIREVLFCAAAHAPRAQALAQAAAELQLPEDTLMEGLFLDLPEERPLAPLREPLGAAELGLLCNSELLGSLLARSLRVRIEAYGNVRAVVRHAKLMGLLCHLAPSADRKGVVLEVSGPFSLFRHTRIYGRALASLVPRLTWCHTYRLEADCVLPGVPEIARLVVRAGDPTLPARELPAFDSKLEERFARAFARLAPHWDVVREPVALEVQGGLMFPDFELRHRITGERWLLEIAGYWTPEYIARKLTLLREARVGNLLLCIDEGRACDEAMPGAAAQLIRFHKHLDPLAVLAVVDPEAAQAAASKGPRKKRAQP